MMAERDESRNLGNGMADGVRGAKRRAKAPLYEAFAAKGKTNVCDRSNVTAT